MLRALTFSVALLSPLLCHVSLSSAAVVRAVNDTSFSPSSDPGIYPGGNINPLKGWRVLPQIDGARSDFSTVTVGNGSATLLHYIDDNYDASKIQRAVIQIHGENRDAWNQWIYADLAAKRAATGGSFDRDEVVVMAPMFLSTIDEGAYPFNPDLDVSNPSGNTSTSFQASVTEEQSSTTNTATRAHHRHTESDVARRVAARATASAAPPRNVSTTNVMIWQGVTWGDGTPCYEPSTAQNAGGFDALDAAVNFFLDTTRFPNLRTVVVAGFSLGGQLVNRYATFRTDTSQDSRIIFWISSPNSFVYMQSARPANIGSACKSTYSDYKYGLNGTLPPYYANSAKELSASDFISRYLSRTIYYLCGDQDTIAGLNSCPANAQGAVHTDKMLYWTNSVVPMLPGSTGKIGQLPDNNLVRWVENTSHEDWKIITSDPGVETVWLKNWYSNGTDAQAPASNGVVAGNPPELSHNAACVTTRLSLVQLLPLVASLSFLPYLL